MAHPLEAIIRQAYAAFGRGDLEDYLRPCTKSFIFNVPGGGAIAGAYRGKDGLYELARKAVETTGGTFHREGKTCWQTITTRSSSPAIALLAMGNRRITEPHTFTRFGTASSPNLRSIPVIKPYSMTLGPR